MYYGSWSICLSSLQSLWLLKLVQNEAIVNTSICLPRQVRRTGEKLSVRAGTQKLYVCQLKLSRKARTHFSVRTFFPLQRNEQNFSYCQRKMQKSFFVCDCTDRIKMTEIYVCLESVKNSIRRMHILFAVMTAFGERFRDRILEDK